MGRHLEAILANVLLVVSEAETTTMGTASATWASSRRVPPTGRISASRRLGCGHSGACRARASTDEFSAVVESEWHLSQTRNRRDEAMTQTTTPELTTVSVPGAELYVENRGSGPVLLLITGGPTDAGMFTDLARRLADGYTVVRDRKSTRLNSSHLG